MSDDLSDNVSSDTYFYLADATGSPVCYSKFYTAIAAAAYYKKTVRKLQIGVYVWKRSAERIQEVAY